MIIGEFYPANTTPTQYYDMSRLNISSRSFRCDQVVVVVVVMVVYVMNHSLLQVLIDLTGYSSLTTSCMYRLQSQGRAGNTYDSPHPPATACHCLPLPATGPLLWLSRGMLVVLMEMKALPMPMGGHSLHNPPPAHSSPPTSRQ